MLVNAHPSLTGIATKSGMSGSTAWNNAVRSRLYLTRPETDDDVKPDEIERVLVRKKANYARADDSIKMLWKDGVFAPVDSPQGVFFGMASRNAETAFLDGLDAMTRAGRKLSDSRHSSTHAPKVILKTHGRGFRLNDMVGAMERLFADGKIKMQDYGRPSAPRHHIVRVETKDGQ